MSEGRIIAALRDEVTAAEVRLEEERAAHTSTQRTAAAREQVPSFLACRATHNATQAHASPTAVLVLLANPAAFTSADEPSPAAPPCPAASTSAELVKPWSNCIMLYIHCSS